MSTERANDQLVTVNYSARTFTCSRAKAKCDFSFVLCTMDPQCEDDCCRLCGFVLLLFFFGEEKETKKGCAIRKNVNVRLRQCLDSN